MKSLRSLFFYMPLLLLLAVDSGSQDIGLWLRITLLAAVGIAGSVLTRKHGGSDLSIFGVIALLLLLRAKSNLTHALLRKRPVRDPPDDVPILHAHHRVMSGVKNQPHDVLLGHIRQLFAKNVLQRHEQARIRLAPVVFNHLPLQLPITLLLTQVRFSRGVRPSRRRHRRRRPRRARSRARRRRLFIRRSVRRPRAVPRPVRAALIRARVLHAARASRDIILIARVLTRARAALHRARRSPFRAV